MLRLALAVSRPIGYSLTRPTAALYHTDASRPISIEKRNALHRYYQAQGCLAIVVVDALCWVCIDGVLVDMLINYVCSAPFALGFSIRSILKTEDWIWSSAEGPSLQVPLLGGDGLPTENTETAVDRTDYIIHAYRFTPIIVVPSIHLISLCT